jgi:phosphatidylserine/phosphatidylglycerophosphate/cardiolipin synthase-like enzyme
MLTPRIRLIRDSEPARCPTLEGVLNEIADNGVQVYILIWAGSSFMPTGVHLAKEQLKHRNIHFETHTPGHALQGMIYTHHQKAVVIDWKVAFVGGLDIALTRWDSGKHPVVDCETPYKYSGQDYYSPLMELKFTHSPHSETEESALRRFQITRMGWHDVHLKVTGEAACDVAYNFCQRWNVYKFTPSFPTPPCPLHPAPDGASIQICRTINLKDKDPERSICRAYTLAIENSKSFVYIENQYFILQDITSFYGTFKERVRRAIKEGGDSCKGGNVFHVLINVPLVPDGPPPDGSFQTWTIMQLQHDTMHKLSKNISDAIQEEKNSTLNVGDFLTVVSLRNRGFIERQKRKIFVSDMIYIHSKVLITDDTLIIGSANFNHRSMQGDTEIAAVIHNSPVVAQTWRRLLSEHMEQVLGEGTTFLQARQQLFEMAMKNTELYKGLFPKAIPESDIQTVVDFQKAQDAVCEAFSKYQSPKGNSVKGIKGHVVIYPQMFLDDRKYSWTDFSWMKTIYWVPQTRMIYS